MKSEEDSDNVLSASEVAKLLFIPKKNVVKLVDSGLLPLHHRTVKDVFVKQSDVLAYREQNRREAMARFNSQPDEYDDLMKTGALISEASFRAQLGVSKTRMMDMVSDGRVFALDVAGQRVFPALLCSSGFRLDRMWKIARIIEPASPALRLDFLTQASGALEDRVPVDLLDDDRDYKQLRAYAKAWTSEMSRTSVVVWDADTLEDLSRAEPLYICSAAIDPRRPLWRRALNATRSPGFTHPFEAPQAPSELVIVVERAMAGQGDAVPEAGFVCHIRGRLLRMTVHASDGAEIARELELATKRPSVLDVADALFTLLAKVSRSADLATGKVPTKKGPVAKLK